MTNTPQEFHGKPIDEMTYEEAFEELRDAVSALESDQQSLENALSLFERGRALAQQCSKLLDQAEMRVKLLAGDELIDFEVES